MARPTKGGDDKRGIIFPVRITQTEKQNLFLLAAEAGLTPTDFVRSRTIGAMPKIKKATPDRAELIRLRAELHKIGSNLNQIARAYNRKQDKDPLEVLPVALVNDTLRDLKKLVGHIAKELGYGD